MFLATGSPLLLNVLKDSRSETLRVTGEDGCLAHVFKPQKQHDDALQSDAAACVGRCAVAERVDVRLDLVGSHSLHDALLLEQLRVMHTLSARHDFLAAHENIIRVGIARVILARHRVEGTHIHRKPIHDVEIRLVLVLDEGSQRFLLRRRNVLCVLQRSAIFIEDTLIAQHLNALGVGDPQVLFLVVEKGLEGVLLTDNLELRLEVLCQSRKHFDHEKVGHVERLGVGLLDLHFKIKPHELGQVAARVAVLSPEHWPDLKDTLHIAHNTHLLVELRRLCKACRLLVARALHILEFKHLCTALTRTRDNFGRVDLAEALLQERCTKIVTNGRADSENGVLRGNTHVDNAVV
mmetsp:Transcript_4880/g.7168  ORF Transcript_4880/g.7168 Transcript_4880/m.7168 type:complete len:351 (-) Transcript_4880:751-1803(-)